MECPFSYDLPENEELENPLHDKDEEQMTEEKKAGVEPIEDFIIQKKKPHMSEFDEDLSTKASTSKVDAERRAVTIDDDQPDFEKDDEFGQSRLHCWVLL